MTIITSIYVGLFLWKSSKAFYKLWCKPWCKYCLSSHQLSGRCCVMDIAMQLAARCERRAEKRSNAASGGSDTGREIGRQNDTTWLWFLALTWSAIPRDQVTRETRCFCCSPTVLRYWFNSSRAERALLALRGFFLAERVCFWRS